MTYYKQAAGQLVSIAARPFSMALVTLFAMSASINAQIALPGSGIINTIGGTAFLSGNGGPATSAGLNMPSGSAVDSAGNLYFADTYNNIIHKVTAATGVITTVAGNGITGFTGDSGAATSAELNSPSAVAVDSAGNLYIADWGNCRIRKVTASSGVITTIAGNGTCGYAGDGGSAASAHLNGPYGVTVDAAGNLYVADSGNNRIRKVATSGTISTVAGNGTAGYSGDGGAGTGAELSQPWGVAVDSSSNILVADTGNNRIRKITVSTGAITTIAGNGTAGYSGDGASATSAELNFPTQLSLDSSGNVYIADGDNYRIRKVTVAAGAITTIAGNGTYGYSGDGGAATGAGMWIPEGVAVDSSGNVYIADSGNDRIRKVTASSGVINTVAGYGLPGAYSGDGGAATSATFNASAVAVDSTRNVYIADYDNQCIRKITASTGVISTVAGNGTLGYSGNGGEATSAQLAWPAGVAVDSSGNIYIADSGNSVIRKVTISTGIITTVAGSGVAGFSGSGGAATSAKLSDPQAVAVDGSGNIYIADAGNSVIWKVTSSTGIITIIAGTGTYGYSGNGGPATSAQIGYPQGVAVDVSGNVYFADPGNIVIQKVTASSGVISTVAGNGVYGFSGDGGAATSAELAHPQAIALDSAGNFYIADGSENRIRKVTVSTGIISTVAGIGLAGFSGDGGAATSAELSWPDGVAVDSDGDIYVADSSNYRVRGIGGSKGTLGISVASSGSPSIYGASVTFTATIGSGATGTITFYDGAASIGSGTISGTTASLATAALAAGSHSITATWPGNSSYNSITSAGIVQVVNKATPTITWSNPAAITTATALSSTQLNATASVAGSFSYSPMTGTLLAVGAQRLSVTFTPTNTTDYNTATASVSIVVTQASSGGGIITTVAGNGTAGFSGDGGAATSAELNNPNALALDSAGNIYISDWSNYRIRKVAASNGTMSTIAGNGTFGGSTTTGYHPQAWAGNGGPATSVAFGFLSGVATDASGNVYLSDADYGDIRKITISNNVINTVAGYGYDGYCGTSCGNNNGPATSALLGNLTGVALDSSGNIYIADGTNYVIWKVTASTGIITLIAGTGYEGPPPNYFGGGYSGDGGPATSAEIGYIQALTLDSAGNVYFPDGGRVRKITASTGIISTVAGNGLGGYSGDGGSALNAEISPRSVAVDSAGNIYLADGARVRKVVASTGVIDTVAGNGVAGYSGDGGPAIAAELSSGGITVDAAGNLYITDASNRIRKITPTKVVPAVSWLAPSAIFYGTPLSSAQLNATTSVSGTFTYTPASGTILHAGSYSLAVTFTPTDTTDYSSVTLTVPLTVNQATPAITWAQPADVPYGTALGASELDASSTVAGTLVYSPGAGAVLPVGPHTLTVTLYPADTVDYTVAYASAFLTVSQVTGTWDSGTVTLIVNGSTVASTTYGQGSTPSTVAAGLATSTSAGSPAYVSSVDDALYLQAKTGGSATDYTYSLQTTSWNQNFVHPSFVYPAITGRLDGGSNQTTGTSTVYSYSVPSTGYDGVGNVKSITDSVMGTWTFSYDTLNRVTGATDNESGNPSTHYCWAYDAFGNRTIQAGSSAAFAVGSPVAPGTTPCQPASGASFTSTWANYNTTANNNQLTNTSLAVGGVVYDAAGNVTYDGVNQYLYDAEGRICAVANTASGSTTLTGYLYNGDGIRVAKGSITEWSCDPNVSGFKAINDYILGPGGEQVTEMGVNANQTVSWQHTNVWADSRLIATYDNDGLHFYFNDILGTRRAQTDYTGVVEQTCSSLPYGDSLSCTNSAQYPTEQHFTGKERDAESGNDYFGARYYASTMGRFLSPDEANLSAIMHMDDPQSWNGYAYGRNNPLKYTDPDGNNYHVCDQYGKNCSDQSDVDFAQNMKNAVSNGEHWGGGKIQLADGTFAGTYVQTYEDSPGLSGPSNVAGARMIATDGYGAINLLLSNAAIQIGTAGLGVAAEAGVDAFRAWRAARVMAAVAQAGREGEAAVRALEDIGPKAAIEINGRTRIPDGMTDTAVNEVKNVSSLAFTRQLRDFADFAAQSGRQFNLWVPGGAKLSGPLQAAVAAGKVTLKTF